MPSYQLTGAAQADSWVLGSAKIEVAASAGGSAGTFTNLGLAREVSIEEIIERVAIQADNGPDFAKSLGRHQVRLQFSLIEFYLPTIDAIRGGIDSQSSGSAGDATYIATAWQSISTGGLEDITSKAYKLTNNRSTDAGTVETVFIIYSATIDEGLRFAFQSDNDEDSVMPIPFNLIGDLDTSRTQNDQLFFVETTIGAP